MMIQQLADFGGQSSIPNPLNPAYHPEGGLGLLFNNIFFNLAVAMGLLLLAYLSYGGFRWITAGGNDKAVEEAKKTVTNAVIGLIIAALAFLLVQVIGYILGINFTDLTFRGP